MSYTDCFDSDNGGNPPATYSSSNTTNAFPTKITLAMSGSINSCYYFGSGKLASLTDQNGVTTFSHYLDSWDRPTEVFQSTQSEWVLRSFPSVTEVDSYVGITDSTPSTTCSSCRHDAVYSDNLGRFSSSKLLSDPDGVTITGSATYDTSGRLYTSANPYRSTSDPTYGLETFSYYGHSLSVQHADGNAAHKYWGTQISNSGLTGWNTTQLCSASTYGNGFPTLSVDEANKMRESWSDGFGNTIEVDEPNSTGSLTSATCYLYDASGRLSSISHTVGSTTQTHSYAYDGLSRVTTMSTPETNNLYVFYYYTTSGGALCSGNPAAVCRRKDQRGANGTIITFAYDALNRLTGKTYSDSTPTASYSYDQSSANGLAISYGLGRLTSMTDGSGTTARSYYSDGRVETERRTIAGVTKTTSYTYTRDGSISSVTYPSGRTVNYTVGNAERSTSATDGNGAQYAVAASYAAIGGLSTAIYGKVTGGFNGITETASYNNRLDLTSIAASSSAGTALNLGYCFYTWVSGACQTTGSNNGTVTATNNNNDTGRTETFAYDPLSRIASATTQATSGVDCWGQSFGADPLANLTTINSIQTGCSTGTLSVTASTTTNQLSYTPAPSYDQTGNMTGDGTYTYTFDAENRITSANSVNYTYDGSSLRVQKSTGTLYWRAISGDVLAETDASGNTKNEYIYFAGQRIAWWDSLGNSYYIYADTLGSARTITKSNGTVCYDADFTPYGQEVQHTNNCPSTYNYKFTGHERDSETGLDYAGFRYYNSRLGRFMSADPLGGGIENPQSLNRYAYVGNNPITYSDPLGLLCAVGFPCPKSSLGPDWSSASFGVAFSWNGDNFLSGFGTQPSSWSNFYPFPGSGGALGSDNVIRATTEGMILPGFLAGSMFGDGSSSSGGGIFSGGDGGGPQQKSPCRIVDPIPGSLELILKVGVEIQLGKFKVGLDLYKNVATGQTGGEAVFDAIIFGAKIDNPTPPGGNLGGTSEGPQLSVNAFGMQKNVTTDEPAQFSPSAGLMAGVGFEVSFNPNKFNAISAANAACRAQGGH